MESRSIRYPAMLFCDEFMEAVPSDWSVTRSFKIGPLRSYLQGLRIVDCHGTLYNVEDAHIKKVSSGFFANLWSLFSPFLEYELVLENPPEPLSLEEFRKMVCDALARNVTFWEAAGPIDQYIMMVRNAGSFDEIITKFL